MKLTGDRLHLISATVTTTTRTAAITAAISATVTTTTRTAAITAAISAVSSVTVIPAAINGATEISPTSGIKKIVVAVTKMVAGFASTTS